MGSAASSSLALTVVAPNEYQQAIVALGAVAYWPLDETSGTAAFDLIGGHDGTYAGNYFPGSPGPTNGFFNGAAAAAFDGATGCVDIPGAGLNFTNAITLVARVNEISRPGFGGVIGHGDLSWRMTINGSSDAGANDGPGLPDATETTVDLLDGNWHLLAYSYSGSPGVSDNGALYLGGGLAANDTIATNPPGDGLDVF